MYWDKRRNIDHLGVIPEDSCRNLLEFPVFLFLFLSVLMLNVNFQTKIFLKDFYSENVSRKAYYIPLQCHDPFMAMISFCKNCNSL